MRDAAPGPAALLAELPDWAALLDRHSTVQLRPELAGCALVWENLAPFEPDARECEFRLGALSGLLEHPLTRPEKGLSHPECVTRGDATCVFAVSGLQPRPDPSHLRLLREAALLAGELQGREQIFRRMARLSPRSDPFPGVSNLRAVRRFIEELEDPVLIFDQDLWLLDANASSVRLFGLNLGELRGLSARELLTAESLRRFEAVLPRVREQDAVRGLLVEGRTRTDRRVQLEVSARMSEDRRILVCLARDVGERLRLERELAERSARLERQNARIAETDRLKSEFLANVSHELTTPITCIKGFAKLLVEDLMGEAEGEEARLPAERRIEFLRIVQRETERMTGLIRGLLELSRIESGVVRLDRARTSLNHIVRETVLVMQPRLDERQLRVELELDPELPFASLDADRIKQVVLNLLDNASKFSEQGSAIRIRTAHGPDHLLLGVRNASRDLTESDLGRIFERFVQRDGTFSRQHGGVGLGLNLVQAIVELHQGRVWAELPEPGCVELRVELPLATK